MTLIAAYLKADRPTEASAFVAARGGRRPMVGVAGYP
jgi:hypothetical protein